MSVCSLLKTNKQKSIPHIYFKISIVSRTPLNLLFFLQWTFGEKQFPDILTSILSSSALISCLTGKDFSVHELSEEIVWLQVLISHTVRMGKIYGN